MRTKQILERSMTHPSMSMWGRLHAEHETGALLGWVVSSSSGPGVRPPLPPKIHWASKEDGKFYNMQRNLDPGNSIEVFDEDSEIELPRAAFIRETLGLWEQEYLGQ